MSIIFKGMEMPPTGNYFLMVENDPRFPPSATIWKRKKDGSLEHFAFARIEEIQHHGDLIDVSKMVSKAHEEFIKEANKNRAIKHEQEVKNFRDFAISLRDEAREIKNGNVPFPERSDK